MFHQITPAGSAREAALAQQIPVRRLGRPEDVANAVMFFAGREASFVTGQVLYVCGGASVGRWWCEWFRATVKLVPSKRW